MEQNMEQKLVCIKFAGQSAWVNDALVSFDATGNCLGIIQFAGTAPLLIPAPLRAQDIAKLVTVAGALAEGGEGLGNNPNSPGGAPPAGDHAIPGEPAGPGRKSSRRRDRTG